MTQLDTHTTTHRKAQPGQALQWWRARSAPISLLVLAAFVLSLVPRRAWAEEGRSEPAETHEAQRPEQPPPAVAATQALPRDWAEAQQTGSETDRAKAASTAAVQLRAEPDTAPVASRIQPSDSGLHAQLLVNGQDKSGVSSTAISVPKGPGTIEGMGESFSAQASTGVATLSVPFELPKARGGVTASLGLSYSSAAGNGVAGMGWSLSVPFIARQTDRGLPRYQDSTSWSIEQDRFVYNGGQELVPIAGLLPGEELPVWATSGWQYFRPRVEGSYLRFFWNPQTQLWRVQDKSGTLLELGGTADSRETDPSDSGRVFRWNLSRQLDAFGNEVRYVYTKDGNMAYLSDVYDTYPLSGGASAALSSWAHHTHFVYEARPDVTTSYTRGWAVTLAKRLKHVEVNSVRLVTSSSRELVRRYHLGYDASSHGSLLTSVKVEGRTGGFLPAMTFDYTHVGGSMPEGFEQLDTTVRSLAGSPDHSVDEDYTDLYDVNGDALPDVVVMMPGLYNGKHGLWLNSDSGTADRFGARQPMGVVGVIGANESVITKHNPNVVALDIDADAIANLVHMPKAKKYGVYSPRLLGGQWKWVGKEVTTSDQLDVRIDLGTDALDIRVFDVNGDGLVDVVKSGGTSYEVWYSLGRYPGGTGLFGSATMTSGTTASLSMEPVQRCVPHAGTPVRFSDADIKLGDMNGDGLTDIVRVRQGDIRYWPGRGDGTFGTGPLGCAGGTFSTNSYVLMSNGPQYSDPNGSGLQLDDVNGDGTADLVQVRMNAVDVWLNIDGRSWTGRTIINGTPPSPSYQNRVRIVDMNGSGTRDIVWGDAGAYRYIDLSAGKRAWLLRRVDNGLGKTTEIEYETSTQQMLAARREGKPWSKLCPLVQQVVGKVTVRDNLAAVGRPEGRYVTQYRYRDPVYDGLQQEFRGFGETEVKTIGDQNSPTSVTSTRFELGERPEAFCLTGNVDYTLPENRWRDNPTEALKGLPVSVQTYDMTGTYLLTEASGYTLRKLYDGRDGRAVYVAFESQRDRWLYDTAAGPQGQGPVAQAMVTTEAAGGGASCASQVLGEVALRAGYEHLRRRTEVDLFGNRTRAIEYGRPGVDETITQVTEAQVIATPAQPFGDGKWSWRTVRSWVEGSNTPGAKRNLREVVAYDGWGQPTSSRAYVEGMVVLQRQQAGSEPPGALTSPQWVPTGRSWHDAWGNEVFQASPPDRCRQVDYDPRFGLVPTEELVFSGEDTSVSVQGIATETIHATCGNHTLDASATYDLGLGAVLTVTEVTGATWRVDYDGFGRITAMYKPDKDTLLPSSIPALRVEYMLGTPVSKLHSSTRDDDDDTGGATYHESWTYVDGLGRTVVTLSEADPVEDGHPWIAQGLTDYDQKGAERRKYLAWWYDGAPESYDLSVAAPSPYGQQRYDAFGRAVETIGLDGTVNLVTRYHALSADAWDAEDLGPGEHQGTYASEQKDGHGRVIRTTERVRDGEHRLIEARYVDTTYLPTGEPLSITRRRGTDAVTRTMRYDSLGRMVENIEPNTSFDDNGTRKTWRYAYSAAGELVGTSDARGCGVNYYYEAAGRLSIEDYAPCEDHHAAYTPFVPEVLYHYDTPDTDAGQLGTPVCYTQGRLVSVVDRAGKTQTCFDGLGRGVEVARRLTLPNGTLGGRWYRRTTRYDAADRPVQEWTGGTQGGPSWVSTQYTKRGTVKSVGSSFGALVNHVRRDADGLVTEIEYGDAAATTTGFTYDELRRLRNLTTYRARPSLWPASATGTQQLLLQDEQYSYDRVGNPTEIRDWRMASEWEAGAKPVTRKMRYDDLYRLTRIEYQYPQGSDTWVDPYDAEVSDNDRPQPAPRASYSGQSRPLWQRFAYDWLGNTVDTDDDQHGFYDRSLGVVTNEGYKLTAASNESTNAPHRGHLDAQYDRAGNLVALDVHREGPCLPTPGRCTNQHFEYQWDEIGRLVRARRWDMPNPPSGTPPDAELSYRYDASDHRVLKTVGARYTAYIFGSLELRSTTFDGDDVVDDDTETVYLQAHGVRLGRVVHSVRDPYELSTTRVYLELGDHLGSTSVVIDGASGEVVERATAYAYGATESDYRPARWGGFREAYRFTGKEEDIEVGLQYFGTRYYAPLLQRWISPDPLAVHAAGQGDLNLYAYVHGRVLVAVDLVGLCGGDGAEGCGQGPAAGQDDWTGPTGEEPQAAVTLAEQHFEVDVPHPAPTGSGGAGSSNAKSSGGAGGVGPQVAARPPADATAGAKGAGNSPDTDQFPTDVVLTGLNGALEPLNGLLNSRGLGPTTGKSDYLGEVGRDTILTLTALRSVFPRSVGQTGGLSCPTCGRGGIVSASSDLALTEPNLGRALDDSMSAAVKGSVAVDTDAVGGGGGAAARAEATAAEVVGRRGAPIEIQAGRNAPGTIGGRDFTGHALDRMQGRGLTPSVIENTIETGRAAPGNLPGTTKFFDPVNGTTVIVDTETGRVITVY